MNTRYAIAWNVCATVARLPPAPLIFAFVASLSLRVALLTGAATKTKGAGAIAPPARLAAGFRLR